MPQYSAPFKLDDTEKVAIKIEEISARQHRSALLRLNVTEKDAARRRWLYAKAAGVKKMPPSELMKWKHHEYSVESNIDDKGFRREYLLPIVAFLKQHAVFVNESSSAIDVECLVRIITAWMLGNTEVAKIFDEEQEARKKRTKSSPRHIIVEKNVSMPTWVALAYVFGCPVYRYGHTSSHFAFGLTLPIPSYRRLMRKSRFIENDKKQVAEWLEPLLLNGTKMPTDDLIDRDFTSAASLDRELDAEEFLYPDGYMDYEKNMPKAFVAQLESLARRTRIGTTRVSTLENEDTKQKKRKRSDADIDGDALQEEDDAPQPTKSVEQKNVSPSADVGAQEPPKKKSKKAAPALCDDDDHDDEPPKKKSKNNAPPPKKAPRKM